MSDSTAWWQVVAFPSAIASIPIVLRTYQWWRERGDREENQHLSADEKRQAAMLAEREQLTREQRETFERVEAERDRAMVEAERQQARSRDLEKSRTKWWNLALYWNRRTHEMRHVALNAQQVANNVSRDAGHEIPKWPDTTLPGLEEPKDND